MSSATDGYARGLRLLLEKVESHLGKIDVSYRESENVEDTASGVDPSFWEGYDKSLAELIEKDGLRES